MTRRPRTIAEPAVLTTHADVWTQELCDARRDWYAGGCVGRKPEADKNRYGHEAVRAALHEVFGPLCAYCEGQVSAVAWQHVEHFRPQSIYPALGYRWGNLLLACERCNSGHKKDRFPLSPSGRQPNEDAANPCSRDDTDSAMLVDPCVEEPEEHFTFEEHRIVARTRRGEETIRVCGLDREELNDDRKEKLLIVDLALKALAAAPTDSDRDDFRAFLRYLVHDPQPAYRGMNRARIRAAGRDPETFEPLS